MSPTAPHGHVCRDCFYFDGSQCRRFPRAWALWPSDNQHPIMYQPMATYPFVKATDWCGEWRSDKS